jgi:hypothetical protein
MSEFLDKVGSALVILAKAYDKKTEAMMMNAEDNRKATEYNIAKDMEMRDMRAKQVPVRTEPPPLRPAPVPPPEVEEEAECIGEKSISQIVDGLTRKELIAHLQERGLSAKKGSRDNTLRKLLIEAWSEVAELPTEQGSSIEPKRDGITDDTAAVKRLAEDGPPPVNTGGATEDEARAYLKFYMDKYGRVATANMIKEKTRCKNMTAIGESENPAALYAMLIEVCKADGITVEEEL